MRDLAEIRIQRARRYRFQQLVAKVLAGLPTQIRVMFDNVEIVIEDEPSQEQLASVQLDERDTLFGLYQGIPLTERGSGYSMVVPDKISIFRRPLERAFPSSVEMARQVRITVIHELAHHVGIDEDRLDELGWS